MISALINSSFKDQPALGQSDSMNFSDNDASDRANPGTEEAMSSGE